MSLVGKIDQMSIYMIFMIYEPFSFSSSKLTYIAFNNQNTNKSVFSLISASFLNFFEKYIILDCNILVFFIFFIQKS